MRTKLIEKLAYKWRDAENAFILTGSDAQKCAVERLQSRCNLTEQERDELYAWLRDLAV